MCQSLDCCRNRVLVLAAAMLVALAGLARGADLAGAYSGDGLTLVLESNPLAPGNYVGSITLGDNKMPLRATFDAAKGLEGTFDAGADHFEFSLKQDQDRFILSSDGATYKLRKQADAPRNPLLRGADAAQPDQAAGTEAPRPIAGGGAAQDGYLGMAIMVEDEKPRVMMVIPDGPADKAGIQRGDTLLALNDKPLAGDQDTLMKSMRGPVGSTIDLRILREVEGDKPKEFTVTITRQKMPLPPRAAMAAGGADGAGPGGAPGNAPEFQPPAPGGAGQAPPPAADVALPAFLKPGVRITYWMGSASIPGVRSHLVQDDKGNWIDPASGKKFADEQTAGAAGAGFYQLNVVHASPDLIAVDARNYLIVDVQTNRATSTGSTAITGNGGNLSDFWIHPARLAQMQEGNVGGVRIMRMVYPLNGRNYKAISIQTNLDSGYTRYAYDLETGLLLVGSTSSVGQAVNTVDPNGRVTPGAGTTMITQSHLVDVRQLNIPWAAEAAPAWAAKGHQVEYRGTYATLIPGAPVPPMNAIVNFTFGQATEGCVSAKMFTHIGYDNNGMPPQESTVDRVFGSAMLAGLWISPRSVRGLQPNQVIDEDPVTKVRTSFAGIQGNAAVIVEQGPLEAAQYYYDAQSGMLAGERYTQQSGIAQLQLELQLAGQK